MVTVKSIVEAYKLELKYLWWLPLACIILLGYLLLIIDLRDESSLALYAQINGIVYLLYTILFMGICFITRPSVAKKDCAYLRHQYKKIILYWLIWVFFFTISSIFRVFMPFFYVTMFSVGYIFTILFFADSSGGPKDFICSIWYALKMILFNAPLLLLIGAFFDFCGPFLFSFCMKHGVVFFASDEIMMAQYYIVVGIIRNLLGILLLPIGICTYANIYIKKLHDQFDLYVKQPQ